jgi:plasmid replication initiation protein
VVSHNPIFSLATKADTRILRYEHRNVVVEIAPSVRGLAIIHDKDILIYCISQLMAKKNAGEPLAQTLHLNAHELLVWTNRETSGDGYWRLKDSLRASQWYTNYHEYQSKWRGSHRRIRNDRKPEGGARNEVRTHERAES